MPRSAPPAPPRAGWAIRLVAGRLVAGRLAVALLLIASLATAGCGTPGNPQRNASSCDQLLANGDYTGVLGNCGAPYDRASAYLGLAGFDLFNLVNNQNSTSGGSPTQNALAALSISASNITTKRQYLEQAVLAVAGAADAKQAFALLVASGLGLIVASEEFLDNGQGGATALDGTFAQSELTAATGVFPAVGAPGMSIVAPVPTYFSGLVGGTALTFVCADIALFPNDKPWCNDTGHPGTVFFYSDTLPGAGIQGAVTGAFAGAPPVLKSATQVAIPLQITGLVMPFTINVANATLLGSFIGRGNAAQGFGIGLLGYLGYLSAANSALSGSGGSSQNALSDTIDTFRRQVDNGATCVDPLAASILNLAYPIYQAALGTSAAPFPAGTLPANFYAGYNRVVGLTLPPPVNALNFNAADFVWGAPGGSGSSIGFRFLYSKVPNLAAFDASQATPRVDETPAPFQTSFADIPFLSPAASAANDGVVTYIELFCLGAGFPPSGVAASSAPGQVSLSWNAVAGATGYNVYRGTAAGVTKANATVLNGVTPLVPTATSYTDSTGTSGTPYYYAVTSLNSVGEGVTSKEVTGTP